MILIPLAAHAAPPPPPWGYANWLFEEFQPDISVGGRANTIAVHPDDNSIILVASESGGLFVSESGGSKWRHVDSLPVFYTNAVVFVPGNPQIVIATASEDFSVANRGGIWRSDDGGESWTQAASPPAPLGVTERLSAYEISVAPDTGLIYVATNFGISIGDAEGKTWTHVDPFGAGDRRVVSVTALSVTTQGGNLVIAGGPAGVRRSLDGGQIWDNPTTSPGCNASWQVYPAGCIVDMHAFGRSPVAKDQAYVVNGNKQLYYTKDGGAKWEEIGSAHKLPGGDGCGGISFVKAKPTSTGDIELYFGNRCFLYRLNSPSLGANSFDYSKTWDEFKDDKLDHGDTRDIAFDGQNNPLLLATDGGLLKPPAGSLTKWTFVGGGSGGFNALQIYEVKGQWIDSISRHVLYFGTQDNYLWLSSDMGKNWGSWGNEGGLIESQYHVATASDSQVTFSTPGNNWKMSGPYFSGVAAWPNPPGQHDAASIGWPKIIRKNFHVQGVNWVLGFSSSGGVVIPSVIWAKGLAVTRDFGQSWQQYATFDEDRRDLPKLSVTSKGAFPVLYQAIKVSGWDPIKGEIIHLARIGKKPLSAEADVKYPLMNNFGGIGIAPTMSFFYRVFAVDPGNANHLIAADVINEKMMETWDAGDNWTEMSQLTALVTNGGQLNFSGRVFFSQFPPMWLPQYSPITQASAISFYPDNPNLVAVGTVQNGIFVSGDRGKTWTKVPGSERATLISALHWRKADDIVVSTYGRGLWRVRVNHMVPIASFFCKLPECYHVHHQCPPAHRPLPHGSSPFEQALLAFGGGIEGVRIDDGIVQEIFVPPGTSVAFALDSEKVPDIKLTETTTSVGFIGVENAPKPPREAPIITGLNLQKSARGSELVGIIFSPRAVSMYAADENDRTEQVPVGRERSPTADKPYLEVLTGPVSSPSHTIRLSGRGFEVGTTIKIAVDGNNVEQLVVRPGGKFLVAVQAPRQIGLHSITIIDSASGRVIDGTMVAVRPEDSPRPGDGDRR